MVEHLKNVGVTLDFSKATNLNSMSYSARINRLGIIDTRSCNRLYSVFSTNNIKTIDKLILRDDGSQEFSSVFSSGINNLTIEGVIGKNGFSVSSAKYLTYESLISIINALQDKTTDTSGTTWLVTLGGSNLNKLTEEEKLLITDKGWTYK